MALSIRNPETDKLVRELAKETGEDLTDAVTVAVRERLIRVRRKRGDVVEALRRIALAAPTPIDGRPLDELLGYGEFGTFDD